MRTAVDRFLRYLESERNASPLTLKSYREDLDTICEFLADDTGRLPALEQITTVLLRSYVSALHEADYAPASVARRLSSLRSFFRFAQREGLVSRNPAQGIAQPSVTAQAASLSLDERSIQIV